MVPDTIIADVRKQYGFGDMTIRSERGLLLVSVVGRDGDTYTGSGGTFKAALRNLLEGGCPRA